MIMTLNCIEFDSKSSFWEYAKDILLRLEDGSDIALSGGSAGKIAAEADLRRFYLWQVDERWIEKNSELSNEFMLRGLADSDLELNSFEYNKTKGIDECVLEYGNVLPESMDLIVLGVGPDGHIGSIFPGYEDVSGDVLISQTEEFDVRERMSLGMNYIMKAKQVLILLQGDSKADIYERICDRKKTSLPIDKLVNNYTGKMNVLFWS